MAIICPTIMTTSDDPHVFRAMMERIGGLGQRVQVDLMDGDFAPHHNISPEAIWWPEGVMADVHLMYQYPRLAVEQLISLRPHTIILHAESRDDLVDLFSIIHESGIKTGLALLRTTDVSEARSLIEQVDHVMIFGGDLGADGQGELAALDRVSDVRAINPSVEVGWDGGANQSNVQRISKAGVDVINVGSALRNSEDPKSVYDHLVSLVA